MGTPKHKKDTRFKPGESGNPSGRPSAGLGQIRADLVVAWAATGPEGKSIREILVEKAQSGDMAAIRIVAERVCSPVKATEPPTPIALPSGSLTDKANAVMSGLGDGVLNTAQAAQLLQAFGALAKVIETDELTRRIEALEETNAKRA